MDVSFPERRAWPLLVLLAAMGCAGGSFGARQEPALDSVALARHASEFYCQEGRWPANASELRAFPLPEQPRAQSGPGPDPIPWELLHDARFQSEPAGSLLVTATVPADSLMDASPGQPLELNLRVEEPGCWPPIGL